MDLETALQLIMFVIAMGVLYLSFLRDSL